jgi:hypothetical protein
MRSLKHRTCRTHVARRDDITRRPTIAARATVARFRAPLSCFAFPAARWKHSVQGRLPPPAIALRAASGGHRQSRPPRAQARRWAGFLALGRRGRENFDHGCAAHGLEDRLHECVCQPFKDESKRSGTGHRAGCPIAVWIVAPAAGRPAATRRTCLRPRPTPSASTGTAVATTRSRSPETHRAQARAATCRNGHHAERP